MTVSMTEAGNPKSRKFVKDLTKENVTGSACQYEHRCLNCGKFRHGEHICQKKGQGMLSPANATDRPGTEGVSANTSTGTK